MKGVWFAVLALLLVIALERWYADSLFQKTLDEVPRMQERKRLQGFFQTITAMGEFKVYMLALMVVFNTTHKLKALYIVAAFSLESYLNSGVFKQLYA